MQMKMAEKRDLIERITELVKNNVLNIDDVKDISRVCGVDFSVRQDDKELTMPEKRIVIERIKELVKNDTLNRDDRRNIFLVCMVACDRELAKLKKEE